MLASRCTPCGLVPVLRVVRGSRKPVSRRFSTVARVFDRKAKAMQKTRAAVHTGNSEYDFLKEEVNRRLLDRLEDVYAHQFEVVMEIGSGSGESTISVLQDREDIKQLIQVDSSFKLLTRDAVREETKGNGTLEGGKEDVKFLQRKKSPDSPSLALY